MRILFAVVVVLLICACAQTKVPVSVPIVPIPDMPPVPTITAAADAGHAARVQVESAQVCVRTGAAKVAAGDNAGALPPLSKADSQLTAALSNLDDAKAHGHELAVEILAQAKAHEAQVAAYKAQAAASKANYETKLAAQSAAAKTAADTIAKQAKTILNLQNEVTRTARIWLTSVGAVLMLAAVGCATAFFFAGFAAGLKVGAILGSCGAACLAVATMLAKIIFAAQIALGVAALAAIGYAAWHLFKHQPLVSPVKL